MMKQFIGKRVAGIPITVIMLAVFATVALAAYVTFRTTNIFWLPREDFSTLAVWVNSDVSQGGDAGALVCTVTDPLDIATFACWSTQNGDFTPNVLITDASPEVSFTVAAQIEHAGVGGELPLCAGQPDLSGVRPELELVYTLPGVPLEPGDTQTINYSGLFNDQIPIGGAEQSESIQIPFTEVAIGTLVC